MDLMQTIECFCVCRTCNIILHYHTYYYTDRVIWYFLIDIIIYRVKIVFKNYRFNALLSSEVLKRLHNNLCRYIIFVYTLWMLAYYYTRDTITLYLVISFDYNMDRNYVMNSRVQHIGIENVATCEFLIDKVFFRKLNLADALSNARHRFIILYILICKLVNRLHWLLFCRICARECITINIITHCRAPLTVR